MMKYRVNITRRARVDISRNAKWWADHHSVEQSLNWADTIYDQLESLQDSPQSNSLSTETGEFGIELRDKLVGLGSHRRYRAVFTIREHEVIVLAVRATEQDRLTPSDLELRDLPPED